MSFGPNELQNSTQIQVKSPEVPVHEWEFVSRDIIKSPLNMWSCQLEITTLGCRGVARFGLHVVESHPMMRSGPKCDLGSSTFVSPFLLDSAHFMWFSPCPPFIILPFLERKWRSSVEGKHHTAASRVLALLLLSRGRRSAAHQVFWLSFWFATEY